MGKIKDRVEAYTTDAYVSTLTDANVLNNMYAEAYNYVIDNLPTSILWKFKYAKFSSQHTFKAEMAKVIGASYRPKQANRTGDQFFAQRIEENEADRAIDVTDSIYNIENNTITPVWWDKGGNYGDAAVSVSHYVEGRPKVEAGDSSSWDWYLTPYVRGEYMDFANDNSISITNHPIFINYVVGWDYEDDGDYVMDEANALGGMPPHLFELVVLKMAEHITSHMIGQATMEEEDTELVQLYNANLANIKTKFQEEMIKVTGGQGQERRTE
tara:strand:+ start:843 stop:1652 length:810 start_codon:yes stop_codon:yes gene_type:complete